MNKLDIEKLQSKKIELRETLLNWLDKEFKNCNQMEKDVILLSLFKNCYDSQEAVINKVYGVDFFAPSKE